MFSVQSLDFSRIPPWDRMRALVAAHLGSHPLMKDASPLTLEASRFGVRMRLGNGAASVMRFQWYLPLSDERAQRLACDLALQAREIQDAA
jgi:hypothetical protein